MRHAWELEKISLPTAAFKEDTDMFSTEFREGFGLWSLIMAIQLVQSIQENIRTSAFRTDLTLFGPYFKTSVRIFSRMDLTSGQ